MNNEAYSVMPAIRNTALPQYRVWRDTRRRPERSERSLRVRQIRQPGLSAAVGGDAGHRIVTRGIVR